VDEVVDDRIVADLDAVTLSDLTGLRVSAHIEAKHDRTRRCRQRDIGFGDAANAGVNDAGSYLVSTKLAECRGDGLDRALHVAFNEERELFAAPIPRLVHHLLHD